MPESLMATIVLGSSSRAVSASFERDSAALPIAYRIYKRRATMEPEFGPNSKHEIQTKEKILKVTYSYQRMDGTINYKRTKTQEQIVER